MVRRATPVARRAASESTPIASSDGGGKAEAHPRAVGLVHRQRQDADRDRAERREAPRIPRRPRRLILERATQGLQRRDETHLEQRPQGEQHGDHEADDEARQDGRRLDGDRDVERQRARERQRQQELDGDAEGGARRRGDESQRGGLQQVDGEHQRPAGADAPQHRDGVELAGHEGPDAARHADAAQQQGDEPHELEEGRELVQRLGEVRLGVGGGAAPHLLLLEQALVGAVEPPHRLLAVELEERLVGGAAAEHDESRPGDVAHRDVDLRDERAEPARQAARHLGGHAGDAEAAAPQLERVADVRAELHQETGVHDGDVGAVEVRPAARGAGLHLAVEGEAAAHGPEVHQARPLGAADVRHGVEHRPAGHRDPVAAEGVEQRFDRPGERPVAGEQQVGAEQLPRLPVDGCFDVGRERPDRDQRRHPDRDRRPEQQEPAA